MPLLRYRYYQPTDGRHVYPGPAAAEASHFRLVYAGMIPAAADDSPEDVLARLVGRHATALRPEGARYRPAGTGDLLDLGALGLWQVLPVGFQRLEATHPQQAVLAAVGAGA